MYPMMSPIQNTTTKKNIPADQSPAPNHSLKDHLHVYFMSSVIIIRGPGPCCSCYYFLMLHTTAVGQHSGLFLHPFPFPPPPPPAALSALTCWRHAAVPGWKVWKRTMLPPVARPGRRSSESPAPEKEWPVRGKSKERGRKTTRKGRKGRAEKRKRSRGRGRCRKRRRGRGDVLCAPAPEKHRSDQF